MGWFTDAVFGKSDDTEGDNTNKAPVEVANASQQASEAKVIPEVIVATVNAHCSADMSHMELWVRLKNTSPFEIEVTEMRIFEQSQGLNRFLKPGESHDCCVYKGSVPTNNSQHVAQVDYKTVGNGDYFESEHQIDYHLEDNNGVQYYIPQELKLLRPVRGI